MRQQAENRLLSGLQELGISHAEKASRRLLAFCELLLEANRETNLTGARDLASLIDQHVLDSLFAISGITLATPIIDVGSGGGFPGIPVAITQPDKRVILLEPRAKRAAFLESAVKALGLGNVEVFKGSALGPRTAVLRDTAGTVLMRAVAPPLKAVSIGLPLARLSGRLVLYEGQASRPTPAERQAAALSGARNIEVRRVRVPGLSAARHVWILRKEPAEAGKPRRRRPAVSLGRRGQL